MPVNVAALGNTIYTAIKDDAASCAKIRTEYKALALSIATDPNSSATVTSATVNGQTFTARATITNGERLQMLRWVVACMDAGSAISRTQITQF